MPDTPHPDPPAPKAPNPVTPRPDPPPTRAGTVLRPSRTRRALVAACLAVAAALLMVAASAGPASAASVPTAAGPARAVKTLPEVITSLTGWVVGILAITATLFLTIGGLRYLIAGGDPGEVEKAKTALRSAAIGYALAVLAPVIVGILRQVLGT
jgi:type IV secretory pathway VirB2 component (pilin)